MLGAFRPESQVPGPTRVLVRPQHSRWKGFQQNQAKSQQAEPFDRGNCRLNRRPATAREKMTQCRAMTGAQIRRTAACREGLLGPASGEPSVRPDRRRELRFPARLVRQFVPPALGRLPDRNSRESTGANRSAGTPRRSLGSRPASVPGNRYMQLQWPSITPNPGILNQLWRSHFALPGRILLWRDHFVLSGRVLQSSRETGLPPDISERLRHMTLRNRPLTGHFKAATA